MTRAMISIHHIANLVELTRREATDLERLLARSNISPAVLDSSLARVTQEQFAVVIRNVVRSTRDELWGLGTQPVIMGSFAAAYRAACKEPTLGDALRTGFHLHHLAMLDLVARLSADSGIARVRLVSRLNDSSASHLMQATFMFFLYGLMCRYCGKVLPLLGVDVTFSKTSGSDNTTRAFRTEVRFDQLYCELRFDSKLLRLTGAQNAETVEAFLRVSPGPLGVGFRDGSSASERIIRLLRRNLRAPLDLDTAAKVLAFSAPTLRRKLAAEGHRFQLLKDAVRRDAAIEALHNTEQTIENIADTLGYAEVSTFHRAFRRWTGASPGDYRRTRKAVAL